MVLELDRAKKYVWEPNGIQLIAEITAINKGDSVKLKMLTKKENTQKL